jgi:hypothetical protein
MTAAQIGAGRALQQRYADVMETKVFKRAHGGYIYRAPNVWVFGRAQHTIASPLPVSSQSRRGNA